MITWKEFYNDHLILRNLENYIKRFLNLPWDVTGIGSSMTQDTDAVLYPSFRPLSWTCISGKKNDHY